MNRLSKLALPIALVALIGGLAVATIYPGNYIPVVVAANTSSPIYSGNLVAYGDVDANVTSIYCFNFDGVDPASGAPMTWIDGGVTYSYPETCTSGTVLNELMCGQNGLIGPNSATMANAPLYAVSVDIDCSASGFNSCVVFAGQARCV